MAEGSARLDPTGLDIDAAASDDVASLGQSYCNWTAFGGGSGQGRVSDERVTRLNVALDGYVETPDHSLDWTTIDDALHTWINDRTREAAVSVYLRCADIWAHDTNGTDRPTPLRIEGASDPRPD